MIGTPKVNPVFGGQVTTNVHVLKHASQAFVKTLSDGVRHKVEAVIAFDLKHDVCILGLSDGVGTPLSLSAERIAEGDEILVAGNPEGLEASFSKGIVSSVRFDLIQMDAAISPGSSGGPVVNKRGEVIGLAVSSLVVGQNLNFAVPIRYLQEPKIVRYVDVRTLGGLAVTDLEQGGFRGPVKTVTESQARVTYDSARNTYVEEAAVIHQRERFSRDGQSLETAYFENGVEGSKVLYEYSDEGLLNDQVFSSKKPFY